MIIPDTDTDTDTSVDVVQDVMHQHLQQILHVYYCTQGVTETGHTLTIILYTVNQRKNLKYTIKYT